MPAVKVTKNERIDVRTSSSVKLLLQEAARVSHKNVSEFLLDVGITAANQALADRRLFALDDTQWAAFEQALDRPVQDKPRLKELLSTPGLLE
ncbi:type II toxin-antitoxin system TacA family antitoxin [Desulfoplanes sp.]